MLICVSHVTRYTYDEPVDYTVQSLRLTPAPFKGQRVRQLARARAGMRPSRCSSRTASAMPSTSSPSTRRTRNW